MTLLRKKRFYAILFVIGLVILFMNANAIGRLMYPIHYKEEILASARTYEVDPLWITAIIRVESNFRAHTVSNKGATGVMQIMPDTASWIAEQRPEFSADSSELLTIPTINIRMGTWYISYLYRLFKPLFQESGLQYREHDQLAVIAASYNAGQGAVQKWLSSGVWDGTLESSSNIPYRETRHYVQRVNYYYKKYKNLYNELQVDS